MAHAPVFESLCVPKGMAPSGEPDIRGDFLGPWDTAVTDGYLPSPDRAAPRVPAMGSGSDHRRQQFIEPGRPVQLPNCRIPSCVSDRSVPRGGAAGEAFGYDDPTFRRCTPVGRLLVSIRGPDEALEAAQGGAHSADDEFSASNLGTPYPLKFKAVRDALDTAGFDGVPISNDITENSRGSGVPVPRTKLQPCRLGCLIRSFLGFTAGCSRSTRPLTLIAIRSYG